jgi:BirA family biotin operon repressor/biotin-[acetyl-CoA-carboxylase] ligase
MSAGEERRPLELAAAERLLAALVRSPEGLARREAAALLGCEPQPAAAVLAARGHALDPEADRWRLPCAARHFDPAAFAAAYRAAPGATLEVWECVASTNDRAREAAAAGKGPGALFLAEFQSRGRGRQGRTWISPPHAGLLVSMLLEAPAAAGPITLLPLALGLGACEGLRAATGLAVRTKWPNDLQIDGRKLGGIVLEMLPGPPPAVVAGLGLNVRSAPDLAAGERRPAPVALCELIRAVERESLLAQVLAGLERRGADWRHGRAEAILAAIRAQDAVLGRRVRVQVGDAVQEGLAAEIGPEGLLLLETRAGPRRLAAGEVHLL